MGQDPAARPELARGSAPASEEASGPGGKPASGSNPSYREFELHRFRILLANPVV